jgi:biotin operon repressor
VNEVHLIQEADEAAELLKPIRIEILSRLGTPHSCPELAKQLGLTTQKVYYHVKVLQDAGLIFLVEERRVRGIMEGVYQAVAKSFWFSPRLVKYLGGSRPTSDQASLAYLLQLAEDLQVDIGKLADREETGEVPSLGLDARIEFQDASARTQFLKEVQSFFQKLAEKYGVRGLTDHGDTSVFRIVLACYPNSVESNQTSDQPDQGDAK